MEDIFWAACPNCGKKFYAETEMRHSQYKLHCPYCHHRFLDSESPEIFEFPFAGGPGRPRQA